MPAADLAIVACSFCCASCSSPVSCALRSRRCRSTGRARCAPSTARSTAALASCAFRCSAVELFRAALRASPARSSAPPASGDVLRHDRDRCVRARRRCGRRGRRRAGCRRRAAGASSRRGPSCRAAPAAPRRRAAGGRLPPAAPARAPSRRRAARCTPRDVALDRASAPRSISRSTSSLPQVGEQRAFLPGERFRFALQRRQAIRGALRQRLASPAAVAAGAGACARRASAAIG